MALPGCPSQLSSPDETGDIIMRRFLVLTIFVSIAGFVAIAADKDADTPAASATRKKLKTKVTVNFNDVSFSAVIEELHDQADNLSIRPDTKGGVSQNQKITYKGKDKTVAEVLDDICSKYDMGYYVISQQKNAYDGSVWITRNKKERGYPEGMEPEKAVSSEKDTKDKDLSKDKNKNPAKDKSPSKDKAANKDKSEEKPKNEKPAKETEPEDEVQKAERQAALKLAAIKGVIEDGKPGRAIELCEELLKKFPGTKAAKQTKELLEKLK
jgi:hypothetical protein